MHPNVRGTDKRLQEAKIHGIGLVGLAPRCKARNVETKT
jgi:hypothetical protein